MLIAQISDPHIRPRGQWYRGAMDTAASLRQAIKQINRIDPAPDVVLLTGDIVDEGTAAEYEQALEILRALKFPLLVIPGNHDDRETFLAHFAAFPHVPRSGPCNYVAREFGEMQIIALDVTVPSRHHGEITSGHLRFLGEALTVDRQRPTLVMMHQPPFTTGIPYLDPYGCFGANALSELIGAHDNVHLITCGHVHRTMITRFANVPLCTAPSTATAIALQLRPDARPNSYCEPPAFLLHHWGDDRRLVTHTVAVGEFPGPFPFA